ncbi:MAG: hypothetical protein AAGA08_13555 [Pseudomonadota bacterium]
MPRLPAVLIAAAIAVTPLTAQAQQVLAQYYTTLAGEDFTNSRGVRLGTFGAVLQQDRANFHRFGIRHGGDESDPYFANKQMRAGISELYRRGPGAQQYIVDAVLSGQVKFVLVRIMGNGGVPSHLEVYEGAG